MFSAAVYESLEDEDLDLIENELQKYPELQNIFSDKLSEEFNYKENPVLNILKSAARTDYILSNSDSSDAENELKRIEPALSKVSKNWKSEDYNTVISNLCSSNFNQSLGALTHVRLYNYLSKHTFDINPEPNLSNNKCSDLELCEEEIVIEVTSLGDADILQNIENMLEDTADSITDNSK